MTGFFPLLRLQLLSRFADLKPKNLLARSGEKKGQTVGKTLLFVFLILFLAGFLIYVESKMLDILLAMGMPDVIISMAVMLATAGTLIMSFFFVLSSLYLGRDAAYLASLPLKPRTILSAKLAQVWISETCIDAVLLLPACIMFGVRTGQDAGFYLRMVLVWLLIAVLPICIIAFVASLLIRLTGLWKHREMMMTVCGIGFMVVYMLVMMNLGGMTGDAASNGEMLQKFVLDNSARIKSMTAMFPPAQWAAEGMLGMNQGMLAVWVLISLAAPVITVWLLGYSYRELSLLQAETPESSKKQTGKESYAVGSAFRALCSREIKTILRVPSYATNILPIAFMPLLMVVMIFIMTNRVSDDGQSLNMLLGSLNPAIVMCVLAAFMAYMAGMNPALATSVSREGKGHEIMKSLPVSARTIIGAKFAVGFTLALLGVLAATIVLLFLFPGQRPAVLLAFLLCVLYADIGSVLALCRDIRKPKLDWVTEQEAVKQNYGMLFSMLIAWAILAGLAILSVFLITRNLSMPIVFLILAAVMGAICIALHIHLNRVTDKYYCAG